MKKQVITFIIFAFSISVFSQSNISQDLRSFTDQFRYEKIRAKNVGGVSNDFIEGSPYLNEKFIKGIVNMNDSVKFLDVPLRYNIYSGKIEFLTEDKIILEIDNSKASYNFKIGDKTFENKQYLDDGKENQGILQLMVDGTFELYKKYNMDFEPATETKGFQDPKPDRFERGKDRYFVSIKGGTPELVNRKKDLIKILKPHFPDIGKFIKSERIRFRSEEDLIRLFDYCNQ